MIFVIYVNICFDRTSTYLVKVTTTQTRHFMGGNNKEFDLLTDKSFDDKLCFLNAAAVRGLCGKDV